MIALFLFLVKCTNIIKEMKVSLSYISQLEDKVIQIFLTKPKDKLFIHNNPQDDIIYF